MLFVPAWDSVSGQKLPNDVPESWFREPKVFPHLVGSEAELKKVTPVAASKKES